MPCVLLVDDVHVHVYCVGVYEDSDAKGEYKNSRRSCC